MRTNPKHKKSKRIIISTETGRMNCYPPESCDPIHPASLIASLMLIDSSCCCATTAAAAASLLALLLSPLPVVLPTGGNNFPPASLCAAKTSASNPCSTRSPEGGGGRAINRRKQCVGDLCVFLCRRVSRGSVSESQHYLYE